MPQICWGYLAKNVDDTTLIEQQIDIQLGAHNSSPDAHLGDGYALWAHRLSPYLDHPYESVRNVNIIATARSYDYIVDPSGNGDFETIAEAITAVNVLGGGSIFICQGTYNITADLEITVPIEIYGEGSELTILDFQNSNYKIYPHGSSGTHLPSFDIHGVALYNQHGSNNAPGFVQYVDNPVFDDVKVSYCDNSAGNSPRGIYFESCLFPRIFNSIFSHNTVDLEFSACSYIDVSQNHFDNSSVVCIRTFNCLNVLASNNYAVDFAAFYKPADIGGVDASDGVSIINNHLVTFTADAIQTDNDTNFEVLGNRVLTSSGSGCGVNVEYTDYSSIIGNQVQVYSGHAIYASHSAQPLVVGNILLSNTGKSIKTIGGEAVRAFSNMVNNQADLASEFAASDWFGDYAFTNRMVFRSGNIASFDLDISTTVNWTDWSLNSLTSDHAIAVLLAVKVRGPNGSYIAFRQNDTTYPDEGALFMVQGSGNTADTDWAQNILYLLVPCDSSQIIEYKTNHAHSNDRMKVMVVGYVENQGLKFSDLNF